MMFSTLRTATLAAFVTSHAYACWDIGQEVQTTSGTIKGHASSWQSEVSEYLGVPYAKPPVGDLRFAAPQPYTGNGSIDAAKFSPDCPAAIAPTTGPAFQNLPPFAEKLANILGQKGDVFDEDCLTLNIWTKPQTGEKAKAVLLWIYGGGFNSGNSQSPAYNGARLANDMDVIVVSVNYRVNIFGFPGVSFGTGLNGGLLDQRLGVEWVRDNIAKFGGDPERITLFGQSAGGSSVDIYSFAWTEDPIVHAFIPQSGTASNTMVGGRDTSGGWYSASEKLGCGGRDAGEATLACMRSKPWQAIVNATTPEGGALAALTAFAPTADNKTVFPDYNARRAAGNFAKLPTLVGNTDNELSLFTLLACVGGNSTNCTQTDSGAGGVLNGAFSCPAASAAKARADAGVKVWRYLYAATWPNQDIGVQGAWHGAELAPVFGTSEFVSGMPDIPAERNFSQILMSAWSGFAKDPENYLPRLGWPVYDPTKNTLIKLGGPNSPDITFINATSVDSGCALLESLAANPSGSGGLGDLLSGGGSSGLGAFFGGSRRGRRSAPMTRPRGPGRH
ncbi:alpha/beta-hydrolase [Eremomyces bilateralis CBS 781.70]|uniref:Carboxylic ester hydrolase n=1 Tax=Eremomyces bilateralis CBS 781.70 TaxID=1392243 RepID=A0A6G1FZH2_9PEZI|nr:alpha/beta-hydrolase [Eremomyces bilateralis CBS 781.70]KAF1810959.1 alpha/beta-hydrolase [Eremomyces bilateralis CBS 781.70]